VSTYFLATQELLDAVFSLPDGVHIVRMSRIPTTQPGIGTWTITLHGDDDVELPDGEVVLTAQRTVVVVEAQITPVAAVSTA
jgi:hypothetical protein